MQGAQAMAVTAWELAEMPARLPHGKVALPVTGAVNPSAPR